MPSPHLSPATKLCVLTSAALAFFISAGNASAQSNNINDAFAFMEDPANGSPSLLFAGPLGGTISLGYSLNSSVITNFTNAGLTHTDKFANAFQGIQGYNYPNGVSVPALLIRSGADSVSPSFLSSTLEQNQILLHGGNPSADGAQLPRSEAVLRFTGVTGLYEITGDFADVGGGPDETLNIRLNGISLFSGTNAAVFDVVTPLLATDVLDFAVGTGAAFGSDSTGFRANIAAVPEPGSFGLLALGGLAMLSRRRSCRD